MKIKLVFVVFLISFVGWGQATLPVSRTVWNSTPADWIDSPLDSYTTTFACSGSNGAKFDTTNDRKIVYFSGVPNQLSFVVKSNATTTSSLLVEESADGTSYSTVINLSATADLPTTCTTKGPYTLGSTTRYVRWTFTKGSQNMTMDDVSITAAVSTPTISLSTSTLTGFTYFSGNGPSATQNFTASGTNLTSNIELTAPTNYEISLASGSGFTNTLTLTQSSGTVNATTIYTRLKSGLAAGTYNSENISATSTSATTRNVSCSGSVTASSTSDIIGVASSESATISSLENDATVTTIVDGAQVWQFKVRDGGNNGADGVTLNDADTLPTILTGFTILQETGNEIGTWSDAINTISLFDGTTFIATGTVNATSIVFSGLNVSVTDNTEKTLSLRLSLKCLLGTDAFDDEDFVFTVSNANVTFSSSGSGKMTFSARKSTNGSNKIAVVASKLIYSIQPSSTGVGAVMSTVNITATDACGNTDKNFTGTVSLTSTGTMTGSPLTISAVAGVATFSNIVHTVVGTGYTLSATASGVTSITSNVFEIYNTTTLEKGDLAILAVNVDLGSGTDQIAFVCFEDILPGTTFYLTDNGYEREFAGEWGGTEGLLSITRTGTTLSKGTIVTIESTTNNVVSSSQYDVYTCGSIDTNWTKTALSGGSIGGFNLNGDDDIWIMQGGSWTNSTSHHSTYNGTVLYGWTESGWDSGIGDGINGTKWSNLIEGMECFTTNVVGNEKVKFNDPVNPDFSATTNGRFDWIRLINDSANWDTYADNSSYNSDGYNYKSATTCPAMTIATNTYVDGKWTGKKDVNWFNCGNWDTLKVPDETIDVQIGDNSYNNQAKIESTATYSTIYGNIAKVKNLTITGEKLQIEASLNNKLEVHGDVTISGSGQLDMDDSDNGTADGQLYLYGNWTNNVTEDEFQEGNSTIHIVGSTQQVINNNDPNGTEIFYNVILDNDFETKDGNNIIANGDFTLNTNKDLTIGDSNYVKIGNNLSIGIGCVVDIINRGSLVMVSDLGIVTNNGTMHARKTTPSYEQYDYTYWSSPMVSTTISSALGTWRNDWTLQFNAANYSDISPLDGFDDDRNEWSVVDQSTTMSPGKGYAAMAPTTGTFPATDTVTFTGTVNNGVINTPIVLSENTASTTDDYNLIGNPYPSAIFADDFINGNPNISGDLYFWTHVGTRTTANSGPDQYNYSANDYAMYNLTGGNAATSPPDPTSGSSAVPTGDIVSGQAFMIEAVSAGDVIFNNAMRLKGAGDDVIVANNNFYRNSPEVKDRIWVSMQNDLRVSSPQLVGYLPETTLTYDRAYDGLNNVVGGYLNFYSVMENKNYKIQSRGNFDPNDKVALGFNLQNAGQLKIKIDAAEGVLSNPDVNVYVEDKLLNITHNLKVTDYVFTSEIGQFNDRFVLKYIDESLSTDDFENIASQLVIAGSNQTIQVKSHLEPIKSITVYDILGRLIFEKDNINNNDFSVGNIKATQQALIIKTTLENGQVVTRKMVL